MADERSGLWSEMRRILADLRPRWFLGENVPGILSVNGGRDWLTVLRDLAELGYGFAYRILDAQYFGLAQRRRRVFIVGCLGDWRRAAEVLFERESLPWDSPPSREAGTRVAASLTRGSASGRGVNEPGRRCEDDVNIVADSITASFAKHHGASGGKDSLPRNHVVVNCLDRHMGSGGPDDNAAQAGHLVAYGGNNTRGPIDVAACLNAKASASGRQDFESETFIAHTLRAEGHDASEDGTGRGTPIVPVAFNTKESGRDAVEGICPTLRAESGDPHMGGRSAVAYGFKCGQGAKARSDGYRVEQSPTLTSADSGTNLAPGVQVGMAVRRLTPRECERLMGFEDDWTAGFADSVRYRMLGNSIATTVSEWLGKRIIACS